MGVRMAGGLAWEVGGATVSVVDRACGSCPACAAKRPHWCRAPRQQGTEVLRVPAVPPAPVQAWVTGLAAVQAAELVAGSTVLVLSTADADAARDLVGLVHDGPALATADARDPDVRRMLADTLPTGRAPAVLALTTGRAAVRAVDRGGVVCLPDEVPEPPTVTEVVQRELTVVGALDVPSLVAGIGAHRFADALSRTIRSSPARGARNE